MQTDDRTQYIEGLRQLAAVLQAHPEIPLPYEGKTGAIDWFFYDDREQLAAIARAFPCTWDKRVWGKEDEHFELRGKLAGGLLLALNANREAVCTRRVVGVEDREVEETVTPAVTRKVTKQVEIVEWDCGPVLRPVPEPAIADGHCRVCGAATCEDGSHISATSGARIPAQPTEVRS